MKLKERLTLLVDKEGPDCRTHLMVEQILQLERLNKNLERGIGIVVYEGGPAEDVEDDEDE